MCSPNFLYSPFYLSLKFTLYPKARPPTLTIAQRSGPFFLYIRHFTSLGVLFRPQQSDREPQRSVSAVERHGGAAIANDHLRRHLVPR